MALNCLLFNKNEIYRPISFIYKLSSNFGLLSIRKFDLENLYLNINQSIMILMKKYIIWSRNLALLLLKKRTLFSKIPAVRAHESKLVSCSSQLWKRLYSTSTTVPSKTSQNRIIFKLRIRGKSNSGFKSAIMFHQNLVSSTIFEVTIGEC